jgi:hypothetical protein
LASASKLGRHVPALALILASIASPALSQTPPAGAAETRRLETIARGIERIEIRRGDFAAAGADRWAINVLVLDPERTRLALGRARDAGVGTETTSSMAARYGAAAAVNGGYFRTSGTYRGEPAGIMALAGKILSEPSRKRPGLAVANAGRATRLAVVDVAFRAEVAVSRGSARRAVNGINRPRLENETIVYTPEFHGTTLTGPAGVEAVIAGGRVVALCSGQGSAGIPAGGWVVSGHGDAAEWVRGNLGKGVRVELKSETVLNPAPPFAPEYVLGGGPRLVRKGKPAAGADPGIYGPGFADARHPRTAVGLRPDGRILLVTVDGRQPGKSVGMTIAELTALLLELGAAEALNMDGGGSTTMVAGGRVVNSPSDPTGERPVGDALLVLLR